MRHHIAPHAVQPVVSISIDRLVLPAGTTPARAEMIRDGLERELVRRWTQRQGEPTRESTTEYVMARSAGVVPGSTARRQSLAIADVLDDIIMGRRG